MKRTIALLLISSVSSFGQTYFGIKLGAEQVQVNHQNIYFEFVDESPSQDRIREQFSIPSSYVPITVNPYITFIGEKIDFDIELKLGLESEFRTTGMVLGVAKKFGNNSESYFSAGAQLAMGRSKVSLGQIYQNDLYIRINGNDFYERSLNVSYYEQQLRIKPFIRYTKIVADKFPLTVTAGYQYPFFSVNGSVIFKGEDSTQDDGFFEERVSLNRRNIAFVTDGVIRKKKVFNQQGVFANIGIAVPLN
ncbi:hypothetical protein [Jiulongibacter sediminis]|uniref:hypothetical protein n=1 Tax=Jiulongibacter sediminis TaxID=1605367 RepID=UPI0026EDD1F7|nr:hypothetical protein [Jiulongibacter sediminis]